MGLSFKPGRQDGGYRRLTLLNSKRFNFDIHLIHYPGGTFIKPHTDPSPVENKTHHRLNIVIKKSRFGGYFGTEGPVTRLFNDRVIKFMPEYRHFVTPCSNDRWVLSIGWLK